MINQQLQQYVQQQIIPQYAAFDKGHNMDHVTKVIENSLTIAADYEVNMDMVYTIAAYHDIGLMKGRADHEKTSARYLLNDEPLKTWFTDTEMETMAEAVCDHRASIAYEPRSIYGKIVSEADRMIDYATILKRSIYFGLRNYPAYAYEEHLERTYQHMQEKYGEGGYVKLWLEATQTQRDLLKLRERMKDQQQFRADFEIMFHQCSEQA